MKEEKVILGAFEVYFMNPEKDSCGLPWSSYRITLGNAEIMRGSVPYVSEFKAIELISKDLRCWMEDQLSLIKESLEG